MKALSTVKAVLKKQQPQYPNVKVGQEIELMIVQFRDKSGYQAFSKDMWSKNEAFHLSGSEERIREFLDITDY